MRAALAAAFAGLLCCAPLGCSAGAFTPGFMQGAKPEGSLEGDVAVLTESNFEKARELSYDRIWLVEFYAPWCKHCQKLAPVYRDAAKRLPELRFAKIDAPAETVLAKRYNVSGYPTIKWMRDGYVRRYKGPQNEHGFRNLAEQLKKSPTTTLSVKGAADTLYRQLRKDPSRAVFVIGNAKAGAAVDANTASLNTAYANTARRLHDELMFFVVQKTAGAAAAPLQAAPASKVLGGLVLAKMDPNPHVKPLFADLGAMLEKCGAEGLTDCITDWVLAQRFPLVSQLNSKNFADVAHGGRMLMAAVTDSLGGPEAAAFMKTMRAIAEPASEDVLPADVLEKFYFGVMDGKEEMVDTFLHGFGINVKDGAGGLPRVVAFEMNKRDDEYFYFEDVSSDTALRQFVLDVASGKLHPKYEGLYSYPRRVYDFFSAFVPLVVLGHLDALPNFSLAIPCMVLLLLLIIKMVCFDDDGIDEAEFRVEQRRRRLDEQRRERQRKEEEAETKGRHNKDE